MERWAIAKAAWPITIGHQYPWSCFDLQNYKNMKEYFNWKALYRTVGHDDNISREWEISNSFTSKWELINFQLNLNNNDNNNIIIIIIIITRACFWVRLLKASLRHLGLVSSRWQVTQLFSPQQLIYSVVIVSPISSSLIRNRILDFLNPTKHSGIDSLPLNKVWNSMEYILWALSHIALLFPIRNVQLLSAWASSHNSVSWKKAPNKHHGQIHKHL